MNIFRVKQQSAFALVLASSIIVFSACSFAENETTLAHAKRQLVGQVAAQDKFILDISNFIDRVWTNYLVLQKANVKVQAAQYQKS